MGQRDLPPLAAIRVFEAAARHLSFTRAAEELGMTQAAVSYQVKVLEERVGAPLFLRLSRAVELTPAGRALAPAASEALERLASAFAAARKDTGGVLSLSVVPTFAAHWLAPRVGGFQLKYPEIAVRITATREVADFTRDDVDVAIRGGDGEWPGLVAHRLITIYFAPMLSPKLAARLGAPRQPADLLTFPLIGSDDPWWSAWFAAHGIDDYTPAGRPVTHMGDQHLEARAAIGGQGVAILTPAFYTAEVESGLLMQPFGEAREEGHSYWLCYPQARRNVPKIKAFREWVLAELEAGPPQPDVNG
jgi:LysR family transcriptional regulator, glycine cleavage system transcriptional activator